MLMGTGSSVGKSLLVAGLARACLRRGLVVRPFKPQNMSNNAGIAEDGREIGRAQVLQAMAAGVAPSVDMNPILLKPQTAVGSQVIVQGRIHATAQARAYQAMKPSLMPFVLGEFRAAARCGRDRPGRGRRQRVGGQSAGRRHRQFRLCPGERGRRWWWSATSTAAG